MKNTHHRLGALHAIGLAIACLSATSIFASPAVAQQSPNSGNLNPNSIRQPRSPRSGERLSQQQVTNVDPQNSLSPEAVERQTIKQQEAYIQQIEWRRRYGDLDSTPGRF